jgi:hypothetical protein
MAPGPADAAAHDAAKRVPAGASSAAIARRLNLSCGYSAWAHSKVSVLISGSWTGSLDQIQLPGSFHFCLVVWPSATSFTSMSSSDLGCLFQTCRPV